MPSRARKKRCADVAASLVVFCCGLGGEEVFDGEEGALADQGDGPLVGVGAGEAGELVAGFEGEADVGVAAKLGEALQAGVAALAGQQDAVQPARAGADRLLDRVQAV